MSAKPEFDITVPKSRSEPFWIGIFYLIVIVVTVLAMVNLANGDAVVPSMSWFILIGWFLWQGTRDAGGVCPLLISLLSTFAWRKFVTHSADNQDRSCIRFGFELLGRRFHLIDINLADIESVEWSPGQASNLAGRDMKDWRVILWYDHGDNEKSKKHHILMKPDQDSYVFGPSRCKEDTAVLGKQFIEFLNKIGLTLIPGYNCNAYTREISLNQFPLMTETKERE